ncbi:MAG: DegT/DnrJ/EryC1/StrS family aminotransferase [Planctomycetota bacterium]
MFFFHSHVDPEAVRRSSEVLASGFVSEGKVVAEFESALRDQLKVSPAVAVNSGTAALHLALRVAGIGPGDNVLVPTQTFVASALAILMSGATPRFVDIGRDGLISVDSIRESINSQTRGIMPVHWSGQPCDMDPINQIAAEHDLCVIEDAAHALGATYRGRPVGTLSRMTMFSFQAIKHLTTGDGGAICCNDPDDFRRAMQLRWFGIDRANAKQTLLGERDFDLTEVGYKYHMNNVAAAIGIGNLHGLDQRIQRHREIADRLQNEIAFDDEIESLPFQDDTQSAWWFYPVLVRRRDDFATAMKDRDIPVSVVHQRIDRYSVFQDFRRDLPMQDWFNRRQINLPVHVGMRDEDVDAIVAAIKMGW